MRKSTEKEVEKVEDNHVKDQIKASPHPATKMLSEREASEGQNGMCAEVWKGVLTAQPEIKKKRPVLVLPEFLSDPKSVFSHWSVSFLLSSSEMQILILT